MDPLKEIGRKQKAMDKGAYQDALNRPVDAIQQSTPYRLADLIMNGEDADIGMAESLIPTVSLQKKLAQGKLPGLADIMDIPNPLSAMAPIGYGLKELRAGARLGKTLRNIEKAKEARDFVHRIHRTHVKDANSIEDKGLLVGKDNPNYSRNTGDTHLYPPSVWMGVDPTNVPVMQHYFTQQGDKGIDKTRTFSIRIPRDVYNERQRVKWEGGRSGTPVVVSGKENPSLSPETARWTGNQAKIDMMIGSIPKEWLSRIPQKKIHELVDNRLAREDLKKQIENYYHLSDIPRGLLDKKRLEVTSGDRLAGKLTAEERGVDNLDYLGDMLEEANREAKNGTGPNETPADILQSALWKLGGENVMIGGDPLPYGTTSADLITGKVKPTGELSPWEISTHKGNVSRGLAKPNSSNPKERIFDWDVYDDSIARGNSPRTATRQAQPEYALDPDSYRMFEKVDRHPSNGHISNAYPDNNIFGDWSSNDTWAGRLKYIADRRDNTGLENFLTYGLMGPYSSNETGVSPASASKILEFIGTGNSDLAKKLRNLSVRFPSYRGHIARGAREGMNTDDLRTVYKDLVESGWADDWWWADPDDPADVAAVERQIKEESGQKLRDLMKERYEDADATPYINPFKHLRDVSTPK